MKKKYIAPHIIARDVLVNRFMDTWSMHTDGTLSMPKGGGGNNFGGNSFIAQGDELSKDRYDLWADDRNDGLW